MGTLRTFPVLSTLETDWTSLVPDPCGLLDVTEALPGLVEQIHQQADDGFMHQDSASSNEHLLLERRDLFPSLADLPFGSQYPQSGQNRALTNRSGP